MTEIFSPNMLKTYEKCPKKYCFKYVKKLSMPVNEEIFTQGKYIHALASYYLRGENIDKMEKSLTPADAEIWNYLKNIEYFKYECINTEYNLSVKIEDAFFGGRLDALVKKDDTYYILDYKTGSAPKNAEYDFQTIIYLLSVRGFFKTDKVIFVYIDLKNRKDVKIELSPDLIKKYEEKLINIQQKIRRKEYYPSKKDCKKCEYGKICYDKILD